ncbi:tetratricopeptide repeat protein [Algiphilus aromaticivorans]|uniref:tetratricopeptide repeat protein n=1 Tax=Algiphilus aromaticivorans TaxID=382454 RepID=UPI0005C1BE8D|nr:tetratricopeptide repeat protein [Algiphilus aromaticivorans]
MRQLIIPTVLAFFSATSVASAEFPPDVAELQKDWANAYYVIPENEREDAFEALNARSAEVVNRHPERAEALVWRAIILATDASISGGLSALGKVREARALLESAHAIDPGTMNGAIPASLGSLYANVPGWPLSYGDEDKAEQHLQEALALNPDSIDAHFFYGELLAEQGRTAQAGAQYRAAINAPERPGRGIADQGRREEARAALEALEGH